MFGSSQGFGYGQDAATQEPKRAKTEDKQTCLPVTVRILQDAIAKHAETQEILIHGAEASIVHLVGSVESLVQQSAMLEFQLNDATGRMKVRYYGSDSASIKGLEVGRYVSIVGNLRTAPTAHVSAMNLQAVDSADEISYHTIEVAHAALRLRNPTKAPALGMGVAAADPITPAKQGLGFGGASTTLTPTKSEVPAPAAAPQLASAPLQTPVKADLRTSVVELLRQVQDAAGEEGTSFTALLARIEAPSEKVKDVLAKLVDEGDVFTTIDDDHFQIL